MLQAVRPVGRGEPHKCQSNGNPRYGPFRPQRGGCKRPKGNAPRNDGRRPSGDKAIRGAKLGGATDQLTVGTSRERVLQHPKAGGLLLPPPPGRLATAMIEEGKANLLRAKFFRILAALCKGPKAKSRGGGKFARQEEGGQTSGGGSSERRKNGVPSG